MASKILTKRDEFYNTVSGTGWTGYKDIQYVEKEVTSFPAFIITVADQSKVTNLSQATIKLPTIDLLFVMLVKISAYASLTLAYEALYSQFETWFDNSVAGLNCKWENADFFHHVIGNEFVAGISLTINIRM